MTLPEKTEIKVSDGSVSIKGPEGEITRKLHPLVEVKIEDRDVTVHPKKDSIEARALWGTFASHISNMIAGVNKPFEKKLIVEGIGFKSEVKPASSGNGEELVMSLGFSHPVIVKIPEGLSVKAEKNVITVSGINKEGVGSFAAKVRSMKKPEPYKGKGIRYDDEIIRRKQGKKSI